jgi:hypothetical protein
MSKERADFIDHEYSAGDELPKNTRLEREVDYALMFRTSDSSVNVNLKNQEAQKPRSTCAKKSNICKICFSVRQILSPRKPNKSNQTNIIS